MTRPKALKTDPKAVPWATQMELAIDIYKELEGKEGSASISGITKEYNIAWETLRDRLHKGVGSREEYAKARQKLILAEEKVLKEYCLQLEEWGCPARVS